MNALYCTGMALVSSVDETIKPPLCYLKGWRAGTGTLAAPIIDRRLNGRPGFLVPAEARSQRRQHFVGESVLLAGSEAGVERRGQDGRWHILLVSGWHGPAAFARILHDAAEAGQLGVLAQSKLE